MLDTGRQLLASVFYLPHIKSYVFDRRVAFVGGIDFAENRQDTPEHIRPDPRLVQVAVDARHPAGNEKPWQDAMVKVSGRAAEQVAMIMVERWWTYCKSVGLARAQAMRPVSAILDSTLWNVKGALHDSLWKDSQCSQMPNTGVLGKLQLSLRGGLSEERQIRIETPQIQSQYLDPNSDKFVALKRGKADEVDILGLHALDAKVPEGIAISLDGIRMRIFNSTQTLHHDGATLTAKWLPEGVAYEGGEQMCKVTLSGTNMWMGTATTVQDSYTTFLSMIRNAKRFVFIENQYFSSDFPSSSPECQHAHDRTSAVLYSGATNRVAEVLLDRIKHAALLKENFSVAIIFPLGTEPGSFYPNLRGAYCFEQTVEDFWKAHALESDWRDYLSFFFLANAVRVEKQFGGPAAAFYGIFTHTKAMVVDDEISYLGSANINDRSLLGRDAEVGITTWGGSFPKQLRETLLKHHAGPGFGKIDAARLVPSLRALAEGNAEELRKTMGISFPQGSFKDSRGTRQLFGMEDLLNQTPTQQAELPYPRSRVVAGGGGTSHFDWFLLPNVTRPPELRGLLFPWSRHIWGMPAVTQIAQIFSSEFNY